MSEFDDLIQELKQKRDELRVQAHLGTKEAQDEWEELEAKMEEFMAKAKEFADDAGIKETQAGLGEALGQLGGEIKKGYERLWNAVKD